MKRLIFGTIIFFLLTSLLLSNLTWTIDNMIQDWFPDPIERCYIVMFNFTRFQFDSGEGTEISMTISQTEEILEENGYKWSDIIFIVHNHFFVPKFSPRDLKTYYEIKRRGFKGVFAVYVTSVGKVYTIRDIPRKEIENEKNIQD